jgi:copper chaperone CopZ
MKMSSYSHATPGRLRIKVPQVKGSQDTAQRVERILKKSGGVSNVAANPLTGNVLVLFDPDVLTHTEVVQRLILHGYLEKPRASRASSKRSPIQEVLDPRQVSKAVADIVLQSAVEFAVRRALLALA